MKGHVLLALGLVAAVAANTASGVISIMAFRHRHAGELALANADLDAALGHFTSAHRWHPGDSPTCVLMGRVIQQALANGLPLEAFEGHQQKEVFAFGLAATTHGIELNPADAWAWFNLMDTYQAFRAARERLSIMRKAGEAALVRPSAPAPPARPEADVEPAPAAGPRLSVEDPVSLAAVFQAIEMEPEFHFYRDYLAKFYWDRGMKTEAAREILASLTRWPRVEVHPALESQEFLEGLQAPILEGVRASALDPSVGPALALQAEGMLLERLNRPEEAIAVYTRLREIAEPAVAAQSDFNIGKLEISLGRHRESLPVLARALETTKDDYLAAWVSYYLGKAHSGLGDHARAAEYLRRHLQQLPKSLSGFLALAAEEEALGNSAATEALYISAVVNHPSERIGYVMMIEHLRKHGKQKQAVAYAEAFRKNSPDPAEAEELLRILQEDLEARAP